MHLSYKYFQISLIGIFLFQNTKLLSQSSCDLSSAINNVSCFGGSNGSATVTPTGGTPPYTYQWNNGQTTQTTTGLTAGTYTVIVVDGQCTPTGNELITNGNLTAGNMNFSSAYVYCNTANCLGPEGTYAVGANPFFFHGLFSACVDHTTGTGNLMIVNGTGTSGANVWCQTITVTPNTN